MDDKELRLQILQLAHHPGDAPSSVVSRASDYFSFVHSEKITALYSNDSPVSKKKPKDKNEKVSTSSDLAGEKSDSNDIKIPELEKSEVTYSDVKTLVLEVAKKKGREAALDLLVPFGVVKGEGKDRTSSISDLKETQYAEVVAAAKEVLT